jgi:hypothetical protein
MSIYIHVGYPKTASTWLQKKFFPKVRNINTLDRKTIRKYLLDPGAFDFNVDDTRDFFRNYNDKDLWLSEELLLGRLRIGGVNGFITKEIANRMKLVFPDGKIIFFIRNQIDVLASSYIEYVRSGGNYGIDKFLFSYRYFGHGANNLVLLGPEYFLYHKALKYYINLFGEENVKIFLFENFKENPQLFISQFAEKFKLDYSESEIDFSPSNAGYRKSLIFLRRLVNSFSYKGPLNKYYLINIPRIHYIFHDVFEWANRYTIFGKKPSSEKILGKRNMDILKNFFSESNQILLNELEISDLEKFHYPL